MISSRLATAVRALPRQTALARVARRGYAEANDGKLHLSLVLPHQAIYSGSSVTQVNLPALSGDMGVLANHVPIVEALKPGVIEVIEEGGSSKKWFASTGFATMHPNNSLDINCVEAYPLDKFSVENVRSALADAQRVLSSSAPDKEKAEATVEVEVLEALQRALSK